MNKKMPLYEKLVEFQAKYPVSFHVPGHKNGEVFPEIAKDYFSQILKLDMTEISGLDDLHAPKEAIAEAETLAAQFFGADYTFFLVGGSTAGNVAMILATCSSGEKIIVQRNSHKSILNALELANANPVFLAPEYDESVSRYTSPSVSSLHEALQKHPDAKAIVLTYPDYFGRTYLLKEMIDLAHRFQIPVLVDEAHGVHFSLGKPLPPSALKLGADAVVQSAHKMAPAMTMASYLHIHSTLLSKEKVAHYLQMIQSSSPSYPLMASLDLARYFLENITDGQIEEVLKSVQETKNILEENKAWRVLENKKTDDPLKITLQVKKGYVAEHQSSLLEQDGFYPELSTHNQILLIHGLAPFLHMDRLKKTIKRMNGQLKKANNRATIEMDGLFSKNVETIALSYESMKNLQIKRVSLEEGLGNITAEAIIPYPPGIPIVLKGEIVKQAHIDAIQSLMDQGVRIQQREEGLKVFGIKGEQYV